MNRGRFLELPSSGAAFLSRWRAPQMCVKPLHGYLGGYLHGTTYTPLGIELPALMPVQVISGSTDLRTAIATTTTSRSKPEPSPARAMMPTRTPNRAASPRTRPHSRARRTTKRDTGSSSNGCSSPPSGSGTTVYTTKVAQRDHSDARISAWARRRFADHRCSRMVGGGRCVRPGTARYRQANLTASPCDNGNSPTPNRHVGRRCRQLSS